MSCRQPQFDRAFETIRALDALGESCQDLTRECLDYLLSYPAIPLDAAHKMFAFQAERRLRVGDHQAVEDLAGWFPPGRPYPKRLSWRARRC